MRLLAIGSAFAIGLATPTLAQIGNPAGMTPGQPQSAPGVPAPHHTNAQDRLFARLVANGGRAEVRFGELAAQRAQDRAVMDFARLMIEDHTAANDKLMKLAEKANILLPEDLDQEHKPKWRELEKLKGAPFDLAYMQSQIVDHQKTVQLLVWEINSGQDAELQRFAADTLLAVLGHLEMAQDLAARLSGGTPRYMPPRVESTAAKPQR